MDHFCNVPPLRAGPETDVLVGQPQARNVPSGHVHASSPTRHAHHTRTTDPHAPVKPRGSALIPTVTSRHSGPGPSTLAAL
nr:unnamed protein product [Digitaria exilis]